MGNLPPDLPATHPYLYCMAHWLRRMQCQDYHSFSGNFIIVGTSSCGCVIMQPCLPFKSRVRQHWSLKGAFFFQNNQTNQNVTTLTLTALIKQPSWGSLPIRRRLSSQEKITTVSLVPTNPLKQHIRDKDLKQPQELWFFKEEIVWLHWSATKSADRWMRQQNIGL